MDRDPFIYIVKVQGFNYTWSNTTNDYNIIVFMYNNWKYNWKFFLMHPLLICLPCILSLLESLPWRLCSVFWVADLMIIYVFNTNLTFNPKNWNLLKAVSFGHESFIYNWSACMTAFFKKVVNWPCFCAKITVVLLCVIHQFILIKLITTFSQLNTVLHHDLLNLLIFRYYVRTYILIISESSTLSATVTPFVLRVYGKEI